MASNSSNTSGLLNCTDIPPTEQGDDDRQFIKLTDHALFSEQVNVKVAYAILAVCGVVGNSLVIATILRNRFLQIVSYYFILSLAVADILACISLIPVKVFPIARVPPGIGGELLCRFVISEIFMWTSVSASGFHLAAIAIEKYIAIVHPFKYSSVTRNKILLSVVMLWVVAIAAEVYLAYTYTYNSGQCSIPLTNFTKTYLKANAIALFLLFYLAPIFIMFYCYAKIFQALKIEGLNIHASAGPNYDMQRQKFLARKKVIQMLAVVFVTFFLCHLANQVFWFGYTLGLPVDPMGMLANITVMLSFSNSCMNPFIYAIKYRKFRSGMKALFCNSVSAVGDSAITNIEMH